MHYVNGRDAMARAGRLAAAVRAEGRRPVTFTLSQMDHLEVLAQQRLWSPSSLKRHHGAVQRFGGVLGRVATPEDLAADTIAMFVEEQTIRGLAPLTVDRDRLALVTLAKHMAGASE